MIRSYGLLSEAFENLNSDVWISRVELAKVIGRAGYLLNWKDRIVLKQMIADGIIEARLNTTQWGGVGAWQYRRIEK